MMMRMIEVSASIILEPWTSEGWSINNTSAVRSAHNFEKPHRHVTTILIWSLSDDDDDGDDDNDDDDDDNDDDDENDLGKGMPETPQDILCGGWSSFTVWQLWSLLLSHQWWWLLWCFWWWRWWQNDLDGQIRSWLLSHQWWWLLLMMIMMTIITMVLVITCVMGVSPKLIGWTTTMSNFTCTCECALTMMMMTIMSLMTMIK